MTLDTLLRTQLTSAVEDTTVPPGLACGAMAGGRRRRRRRAVAGGLALATVAVVATAVAQLPGSPLGLESEVASGASTDLADGLEWARSLPQGDDPGLPFFGEGGLWSDGRMYDVTDEVNVAHPPRQVAGGWLVLTGQDEERLGLAVLSPAGELRGLPANTFVEGFGDARVEVSPDGRRVAYGRWVVDLATMQVTPVPHQPESGEQDGYYTGIRMIGFVDDGLVYEGAPFSQGIGTTWLLRDDGTTVEVDPPEGHISDGSSADLALSFDYAADDSDTCVTPWVLREAQWERRQTGCMGDYLGEALTTSPDARWLLTDDLPQVWSLADGDWAEVEVPADIGKRQMDAQMGGAVWESEDTFLLPFADRWAGPTSPEPEFDQHVQVVRCTMSTGACERAGDEHYLRVVATMWGTNELRFAQP